MALFNKKPTKKTTGTAASGVKKSSDKEALTLKKSDVGTDVKKVVVNPRMSKGLDLAMVLLRPHITEKATDLSEQNVYAFQITKLANKMHVRQAIEKFYKVRPVKIAVINGKPKYMKNPRTGRMQVKKTGDKKALVYLKKGDKIEFV